MKKETRRTLILIAKLVAFVAFLNLIGFLIGKAIQRTMQAKKEACQDFEEIATEPEEIADADCEEEICEDDQEECPEEEEIIDEVEEQEAEEETVFEVEEEEETAIVVEDEEEETAIVVEDEEDEEEPQ